MRVRWSREARTQYKHQRRYLAERNLGAADQLFLDVRAAESLIARNPEFGRSVGPRQREWGIGRSRRYVLRYVIESVAILVTGFWHTAQLRPVLDGPGG
ncbi:type II toxin-antitoxin system RelE/ParE family toxin [Roseateles sp. 22389]|uniref:type II toxin-antitoxin system RelE/ParE family toxin n=1 Tax=Roseateles sp. 22389 TaxID=3453916 RepID=UPI003F86988B